MENPNNKKRMSSCDNTNTSTHASNIMKKTKSSSSIKNKRSIVCHGCKKTFMKFKNKREFIDLHGCKNLICSKALFQCKGCNIMFYSHSDRMKHWKTKKNQCMNKHRIAEIPQNFATSQVDIPHVKSYGMSKSNNIGLSSSKALQFSHIYNKSKFAGITSFMVSGMTKDFTNKKLLSISTNVNIKNVDTLLNGDKNQTTTKEDDSNDVQQTIFATEEDDLIVDVINSPHTSVNGILQNNDSVVNNITNIQVFNQNNNNNNSNNSTTSESIIVSTNRDNVINDNTNLGINPNDNIQVDNDNVIDITQGQIINEVPIEYIADVIDFPKQRYEIRTTNHLMGMKHRHKLEQSNLNSDTYYKDGLELIQLLMKKKMSLTSYDDFMSWKYCNKKQSNSYYTFDCLKKKAEYRVFGKTLQHKMSPKTTLLECPTGRKVSVVTYDLDSVIYDMLSDTELTCWKNLIFKDGNEHDPFLWNIKDYYDDFDQSTYYNETFKNLIGVENRNTHLLVPLAIYMDETTLDSFGKLSLHPVCITLMIYDRSTRNLEMSWRTIGYMPNINAIPGTKSLTAEDKLNDFHYILRFILYGIEELQSVEEGLEWEFQFPEFGNRSYKRVLKFPLSHVVGDAKGNDTLVGRYQNRNKAKFLCRDCDCPTVHADDPNYICNFLQYKDLKCLTAVELKEKSFRKLDPYNAFDNISMGNYPYGLNGGTPAEPCHQINKGPCEVLPNVLLNERFSLEMAKMLDSHVSYLVTNFSRQSDRSLPELRFFSNGVSENAKLSSNENIGRLYAIYLTLLTRDFEKHVVGKKGRKPDKGTQATVITQNEYNQWILVFEETLILTAWVYTSKHPKVVFKGGKKSLVYVRMKEYMNLFRQIANRKTGMGLKLLKFHQLLHLWFIIRAYGSLSNIDSARNESHHKKKKTIASHTQKRFNLLEHQTADHEYTYNLFLKAMRNSFMEIPDHFEMKIGQSNEDCNDSIVPNNLLTMKVCGSKFLLTLDYRNNVMRASWISKSKKKQDVPFPNHVLEGLYSKLRSYNHGVGGRRVISIEGFTELKHNDGSNKMIFRVCPAYRSGIDWFDWAILNWGEIHGELAGQLLIFIDINTMRFEDYVEQDELMPPHDLLPHNLMVLVHSVGANVSSSQRNPASHTNDNARCIENGPIVKCSRFCTMENNFQLVSCETIVKEVFVLVDEPRLGADIRVPGSAKNVIVVNHWDNWHLSFLDYSSQSLLDDASNRIDNEIPENSERFPYEG